MEESRPIPSDMAQKSSYRKAGDCGRCKMRNSMMNYRDLVYCYQRVTKLVEKEPIQKPEKSPSFEKKKAFYVDFLKNNKRVMSYKPQFDVVFPGTDIRCDVVFTGKKNTVIVVIFDEFKEKDKEVPCHCNLRSYKKIFDSCITKTEYGTVASSDLVVLRLRVDSLDSHKRAFDDDLKSLPGEYGADHRAEKLVSKISTLHSTASGYRSWNIYEATAF